MHYLDQSAKMLVDGWDSPISAQIRRLVHVATGGRPTAYIGRWRSHECVLLHASFHCKVCSVRLFLARALCQPCILSVSYQLRKITNVYSPLRYHTDLLGKAGR